MHNVHCIIIAHVQFQPGFEDYLQQIIVTCCIAVEMDFNTVKQLRNIFTRSILTLLSYKDSIYTFVEQGVGAYGAYTFPYVPLLSLSFQCLINTKTSQNLIFIIIIMIIVIIMMIDGSVVS